LILAYDGTNYKGWQLQPDAATVQREIERVLREVYGKDIRVHGASRTDAGVHARHQAAHYKAPFIIPAEKIPIAVNTYLAEDVVVLSASYEKEEFHSRFSAKRKRYEYIMFSARRRDPFRERYSWRVPYKLDVPLMRRELLSLLGEHDFRSFQASDKKERTSVRTMYDLGIKKKKDGSLVIHMEGNGFIYNMVRNVVGTLMDIGRGHLAPGTMERLLEVKNRAKGGNTAPSRGLFLTDVKY
jgi:tRNA pseudouridine38-40 synthase